MNKTISRFILSTGLVAASMFVAPTVFAQCAAPVSIEGGINYDATADTLNVCDGTNWLVVGPGGISADSIDWDDITDTMTLDATTTIDMTAGDLNFDSNTFVIDSSANAIGIGTAAPNANAALDVNGTNKGFLPPRNTDPGTNITGTAGLIAYDSTDNDLQFFDGTSWVTIGTTASGDNLGNHTATENIQLGTNWLSNDGDNEGLQINAATGAVLIQSAAASDEELHIGPEGGTSTDTAISMANNGNTFEIHVQDDNLFRITDAAETANWFTIEGATGNVGIGTDDPDAIFHIGPKDITTDGSTPDMILSAGTPPSMMFSHPGNDQTSVGITSNDYFAIATESTQSGIQFKISGDWETDMLNTATVAMTIATDGDVAIGSSAPNANALLDLNGGTNKGFLPPLNADPGTNITGTAGLIAYDSTDNELQYYDGSAWVAVATGAGVTPDSLDWSDFTDTMTLDATTTIDMDTNTADLNFDAGTFYIDSSENRIGIGTVTPNSFDSTTNGTTLEIRNSDSNGSAELLLSSGNNSTNANPQINFAIDTTHVGFIRSRKTGTAATASHILFGTHDGTTLAERMRVAATGEVGIGTATPTTDLHVYDGTGVGAIAVEGDETSISGLALHTTGDGATLLGSGAGSTGWLWEAKGSTWATADEQRDLFLTYWDGSAWDEWMFVSHDTGYIGLGGNIDPYVTLDVTGTIKMGDGGESCDANREGGMKYDAAGDTFYFCAATASGWEAISLGSGVNAIDDLSDAATDASSVFLGSGSGTNDDGTTNRNTAVGISALAANTAGNENTAIGNEALTTNITGDFNTALGYRALYLNTGGSNTAVGWGSLSNNSTAADNTAVGEASLNQNTTGANNTAVGYQALYSNQTGTRNTAMGHNALFANTGNDNAAFGQEALYDNTSGVGNSAFGNYALENNLGGGNNTGFGLSSLAGNTSGSSNTGIGRFAGATNTTGSFNVAIGDEAMGKVTAPTTGAMDNNTVIGYQAGVDFEGGAGGPHDNTLIGFQAGSNLTTGDDNIIIGSSVNASSTTADNELNIGNLIHGDLANSEVFLDAPAAAPADGDLANGQVTFWVDATNDEIELKARDSAGDIINATVGGSGGASSINGLSDGYTDAQDNLTLGLVPGSIGADNIHNVSVGPFALGNITNTGASGNPGDGNTVVGAYAAQDTTTGYRNTFMGTYAGEDTTTGYQNTAIGYAAMWDAPDAHHNVAVGNEALATNTGAYNTAIGTGAMSQGSGDSNIAVGQFALNALTGGVQNIAIGSNAGNTTTTGGYNILIGEDVIASSATASSEINIGDTIYGDISNSTVFLDAPAAAPADGDLANGQVTFWVDATNNEIELKARDSAGDIINATVGSGGGGSVALNDITDVWHDPTTDFSNGNLDFSGDTDDDDNLFIGHTAASLQGTADPNKGAANTAIGATALDSVTEGDLNIAIGLDALTSVTDSYSNIGIGSFAGMTMDNTSYHNVFIGNDAARLADRSFWNVAVGYNAARNGVGFGSVAIGAQAMSNLTTPWATSQTNVAIGLNALNLMDSGGGNVVIGVGAAGVFNTTGRLGGISDNVIIGDNAGNSFDASGSNIVNNTIVGGSAGDTITTGTNNILLGYNTDTSSATASNEMNIGDTIYSNMSIGNVGIGVSNATSLDSSALFQLDSTARGFLPPRMTTTQRNAINGGFFATGLVVYNTTDSELQVYDGSSWVSLGGGGGGASALNDLSDATTDYATDLNLFIGEDAGAAIASGGRYNTLIGIDAGDSLTTGDENVVIGRDAGQSMTVQGYSTLVGHGAGVHFSGASEYNSLIAIGHTAAGEQSGGFENIAIGNTAMNLGGGDRNTVVGGNAGVNGIGDENSLFGHDAMNSADGSHNVVMGQNAARGQSGADINRNVIIGHDAANGINTGANDNVIIGFNAGNGVTTGASNIIIGSNADTTASTASNELNIGNVIYGDLFNDYVGINQTDPEVPLHIGPVSVGSSGGTHEMILSENTGGQPNILFTDAGNDETSIGIANDDYFAIATEDTQSGIQFKVNADYTTDMLNTGTVAMTIETDGDVGIGTTTATTDLHVYDASSVGAIAIEGDESSISGLALHTTGNGATLLGSGTGSRGWLWEAKGSTWATTDEREDLFLTYWDGSAWDEWMFVAHDTGYIGLGGNIDPTVTLDITGDIEYTGTITDVSDRRLKDNIKPLPKHGSLIEKINAIDTYSFTMKDDEDGKTEFGVMAQELEKIFPELVRTADDEMGTKSVNYVGLIAPMIEATKELKSENDALKAEINDIKQDIAGMKMHTGYGFEKANIQNLAMMLFMMIFGGACVIAMNRFQRKS